MKYFRVLILLVPLLMALSTAALAQEQPKYNFASAQGSKEIKVTPGGEGAGSVYFYNIDGNQITHIALEISQAPANWQVTIEPPREDTLVEIGGKVITVNENLYVEPSRVLSQKVEDTPAGTVCITVPSRGYALAKEARVTVRVPGSEKIGTTAEIVVAANAQWLGQTGAAAIKQSRDFNFSVEVISQATDAKEKILGKASATSGDTSSAAGGTSRNWLPWAIGGAVILLVIILVPLYISRRRD